VKLVLLSNLIHRKQLFRQATLAALPSLQSPEDLSEFRAKYDSDYHHDMAKVMR